MSTITLCLHAAIYTTTRRRRSTTPTALHTPREREGERERESASGRASWSCVAIVTYWRVSVVLAGAAVRAYLVCLCRAAGGPHKLHDGHEHSDDEAADQHHEDAPDVLHAQTCGGTEELCTQFEQHGQRGNGRAVCKDIHMHDTHTDICDYPGTHIGHRKSPGHDEIASTGS